MTPFELGYIDFLEKRAFRALPTLSYTAPKKEEKPKTWRQTLEEATKTVLGIKDPEPFGYGVGKTKIGDKQVSPPYHGDPAAEQKTSTTVNNLKKKWSMPGMKATNVGSGTVAMPRMNIQAGYKGEANA